MTTQTTKTTKTTVDSLLVDNFRVLLSKEGVVEYQLLQIKKDDESVNSILLIGKITTKSYQTHVSQAENDQFAQLWKIESRKEWTRLKRNLFTVRIPHTISLENILQYSTRSLQDMQRYYRLTLNSRLPRRQQIR